MEIDAKDPEGDSVNGVRKMDWEEGMEMYDSSGQVSSAVFNQYLQEKKMN
jgi:hypothetical protein